jgi:flagellar hook-associated protein 3
VSSIRVNPFALPDLLAALGNTRQQADTASLELATGSRINQPSDDPGGAAQLISNHDQSSQADSFLRSISSVNGLLQTADSTLGSVVTVLQRAISLGVEGANGTLSASDRADIATELTGIQQQLISLGNASYQGEFIFSGTSTVLPFVADTTSASGVSYKGNAGVNSIQAGQNYSLAINQPGSQVFTAAGADVFQSVSDLIFEFEHWSRRGRAQYCLRSHHQPARLLRQRSEPVAVAAELSQFREGGTRDRRKFDRGSRSGKSHHHPHPGANRHQRGTCGHEQDVAEQLV